MENEVLDLLAEICEDDVVKEDLQTELFESGLMDSLGFAEFLVELEDFSGAAAVCGNGCGMSFLYHTGSHNGQCCAWNTAE